MRSKHLLVCMLLAAPVQAQAGDNEDPQPDLPASLKTPPAPALSPEDAHRTLQVQDGFRIELAASDPLVHDPVSLCFDAQARMWVVEMRGFMPDIDGTGEDRPIGKIVVLEDADGDGHMDRRTVFLDGLRLPRGVRAARDGVLVIAPPRLLFCRDTDGDGRCDQKTVVLDSGFEAGLTNPEHAGNGLLYGLDNWFYLANFGKRLRWHREAWRVEPSLSCGQWGLTQDDWGRRYYNTNSCYLLADLYPSHYAVRNDQHRPLGVGIGLDADQSTWPRRVTPGINRGYQPEMLRDFKLARFTAACGPCIYRGHLFGDHVRGNAFVPEPAGNFVRRAIVEERGGTLRARNAYEQTEWLTSTDERFRPVNCYTGPDGALYIVDMYRGVIQHKNFVTTFLRRQVIARKLEQPLGLGRIWRVVPPDHTYTRPPNLGAMSSAQLVAQLAHPNGWTRQTAQRLLVERADRRSVSPLRRLLEHEDARARLHALHALAGMHRLTGEDLAVALRDPHPRVRAAAAGLAPWQNLALALGSDPDRSVRLAVALRLGDHAAADSVLAELLRHNVADRVYRSAAITGLGGRELAFLERLLTAPDWREETPGTGALLSRLAGLVVKRREPEAIARLLHATATCHERGQQAALLDGMIAALPGGKARAHAFRFGRKPTGLTSLERAGGHTTRLAALRPALWWPGLGQPAATGSPLSKTQQRLMRLGRHYYAVTCAQCHQPHGRGQQGVAPSLVDSEMVLGPPERQIRLVLHGITGPIEIDGKINDLTMEPLAQKLNDRQIAAILTYTRRAWGHMAEAVDVADVTRVRAATNGRTSPWTREELRKIQ